MFMLNKLSVLPFFFIILHLSCQNKDESIRLNFNLKKFREDLDKRANYFFDRKDSIVSNKRALQEFFWLSEVLNLRNDKTEFILKNCSGDFFLDAEFLRAYLECVIALFPDKFNQFYDKISRETNSSRIFAMCLYGEKLNGFANQYLREKLLNFEKKRSFKEDPIVYYLKNIWLEKKPLDQNQTKILLRAKIFNLPIIYVFLSIDRNKSGYCFIKNEEGKFLKETNGYFYSKVLGRSISGMPSIVTNGNSPCGIYSFSDSNISENKFIGIVPIINLYLPFEIKPSSYFHNMVHDSAWSIELYQKLLPKKAINIPMLYETYYAGQAGRNEIAIHGTTIDPDYYIDEPYYPYTPSLGCFVTYEIWNEKDSSLIHSEQFKLINMLSKNKIRKGFVVVAEIQDELLNAETIIKYISEID